MDKEKILYVGSVAKKIRDEVFDMVKVGTTNKDIINYIEKSIFEKGLIPAFPAMIVIDEVAAHYTIFDDEDIVTFKKGDVVNVDFGIKQDGWICDNAFTKEIETENHTKLLKTNKLILDTICEKIKIGTKMWEIGKIVEDISKENGFKPIRNLCGHQIENDELHSPRLSPPNFNNGDENEITPNTLLAIEPFITYGDEIVKAIGHCNILKLESSKPIRDVIGKIVLIHIKKYFPKTPFSKRWLVDDVIKSLDKNRKGFPKQRVLYAVNMLKKNGNLKEYEILSSNNNQIVSQFEHTFFFDGNGEKFVTTR